MSSSHSAASSLPPWLAKPVDAVRGKLSAMGLNLSQRDTLLFIIATVVLIVGVLVVVFYPRHSEPSALPPTPPSPVETPTTSAPASSGSASKSGSPKHKKPKPIKCSHPKASGGDAPQSVCIPSLGVDADVLTVGLNKDRTVQVPPLSQVADAAWYKYSASPGSVGPTVILGHVDSAQYGDGVFYHLADLHTGDKVVLARGDGKLAVFVIDRVRQVSKSKFPTDSVYGSTSGPAIRLVTCGGKFNTSSRSYEDNIIAYGTLQTIRKA